MSHLTCKCRSLPTASFRRSRQVMDINGVVPLHSTCMNLSPFHFHQERSRSQEGPTGGRTEARPSRPPPAVCLPAHHAREVSRSNRAISQHPPVCTPHRRGHQTGSNRGEMGNIKIILRWPWEQLRGESLSGVILSTTETNALIFSNFLFFIFSRLSSWLLYVGSTSSVWPWRTTGRYNPRAI